ncbi:hypothetical protein DFJ63DRAFT_335220 [Scheffersomyces coipomensis]|uniref:uncharacterized protein n=1 Tax=Scheffersomyces coipomensis TaxID=1788519 RepID=UPI00315DB485
MVILLPLSIITYVKFYNTLIPYASPRIPIHYKPNSIYDYDLSSDLIHLQSNLPRKFKFDPLLDYKVSLNFEILCDTVKKGDVYQNSYSIINDQSEPLFDHEFYVDCDSRYIYNNNNDLVPYNLRFWVPPMVVNIKRSIGFQLSNYRLNGKTLPSTFESFQILIDKSFIIVQDSSFIEFEIVYTGFRYYLVKHYYKCLFIGVLVFWSISCSTSFLTSMYLSTKYARPLIQDPQAQNNTDHHSDDDYDETEEIETESEETEFRQRFSNESTT